jgi:septal ring factor EnvC (AmiA/AmiB activator)
MGRRPIGKQAMSGSERQRRYLARLLAAAAATGADSAPPPGPSKRPTSARPGASDGHGAASPEVLAELAQLKAELAQAKAKIAEMRDDQIGQRFAPRPRQQRAAKPALPPDEERDRTIARLKTTIQNLRRKVAGMAAWHQQNHPAIMPFATMSAIVNCLHPDKPDAGAAGQRHAGLQCLEG